MRYIFLDVDGVLTTIAEYGRLRQKFWKKHPDAEELHIPYPFNQKCVEILNEILLKTDSKIILSSDWQFFWTLEELDKIFKFNNVVTSPIDVTGRIGLRDNLEINRSAMINKFIEENNVKCYVIIDDMDLSLYVDPNHFIKTNEREGLKQLSIKEKIIKILENNDNCF